jgi:hypothetical protein
MRPTGVDWKSPTKEQIWYPGLSYGLPAGTLEDPQQALSSRGGRRANDSGSSIALLLGDTAEQQSDCILKGVWFTFGLTTIILHS